MRLVRAFIEGFMSGWNKQRFSWDGFFNGMFDALIIIVVWELINGRSPI
jgi:hypothetical protein